MRLTMKLGILSIFGLLLLLSSCYSNGYHPTYIISEESESLSPPQTEVSR